VRAARTGFIAVKSMVVERRAFPQLSASACSGKVETGFPRRTCANGPTDGAGAGFDPEQREALESALEICLRRLDLVDRTDPLTTAYRKDY
jgi:hypothetical protein